MASLHQTDSAARNLVIADLFFGLGAVLLIVIAVISLSVKDMLSDLIATSAPDVQDTERAVQALAMARAPVLYATSAGLHRVTANSTEQIGLNDISAAPLLAEWLADTRLLIIDPAGQEAAFLTFARAARSDMAGLNTLRLTSACRSLQASGADQFACGR